MPRTSFPGAMPPAQTGRRPRRPALDVAQPVRRNELGARRAAG